MEEPFAARPLVGRWIALDVRPTRPLTLIGPSWAVLCGALASGALLTQTKSLLLLALAVLLCDLLLGTWRALWLQPDWRQVLNQTYEEDEWQSYALDSTSNRWLRLVQLGYRRVDHFATSIWPIVDSEVIGILVTATSSICIALVLGILPLTLTILALLLAILEGLVGTIRGAALRSLVDVTIPWLIAQTALGSFSWSSVVLALLFTFVYRSLLGMATLQDERWISWGNLPQLGVAVVLVFSNMPAGAGLVLLGLLAQILWQARFHFDGDGQNYARRVQSYLLVSMLAAAISIWI